MGRSGFLSARHAQGTRNTHQQDTQDTSHSDVGINNSNEGVSFQYSRSDLFSVLPFWEETLFCLGYCFDIFKTLIQHFCLSCQI